MPKTRCHSNHRLRVVMNNSFASRSSSRPRAPWTLRAWPPLLWQLGKKIPLHPHHIGTHVTHLGTSMFRPAGQTFWAWTSEDGEAGVAWDWVVLARGIVAMADPMAVTSNLQLIGEDGDMLTNSETARHLNFIVHGLPWQQEVVRALNNDGTAPSLLSAPPSSGRAIVQSSVEQQLTH